MERLLRAWHSRLPLETLVLGAGKAVAILLGVFRAAATESSPRHDRDRGTEQSSPAAEGLIRSQSLCLFLMPGKGCDLRREKDKHEKGTALAGDRPRQDPVKPVGIRVLHASQQAAF